MYATDKKGVSKKLDWLCQQHDTANSNIFGESYFLVDGLEQAYDSDCDLFSELGQGGECSRCLPFSTSRGATPSLRVTVR